MSVQRQLNVLGQMRIDAAHIRSIESSIAKDFDLLAGNIVAGKHSYVVRGLTIPVNGVGTVTADRLVLRVAGATLIHPTASDPAAFFAIPDSEQNQPLSSTNEKVEGAFTANSVNYVGLDLIRIADPNSYDTVKFLDADTEEEAAKTIPLGRILDYRIVISPQSFSVQPHLLPIAKVTTDASNVVTKIEDARPLLFRLGSGGDSPNSQNRFDWGSRLDNRTSTSDASTDPFTLGDRSIRSQKDWMDAVMTRLWELGGGPSWFSPSSDRDIKVAYGPPLIGGWGNVSLTGDTLRWQSIQVLFANSPATANIVADETSGVSFPDGSCLCVDIDRETDQKVVHAKVFSIKNVGTPLVPGSRIIIAWRVGDNIFLKDAPYENGRSVPVATAESEGVVRLHKVALDPAHPVVLTDSSIHNKGGANINDLSVAAVKDDRLLAEGSSGDWIVDGVLQNGADGSIGTQANPWPEAYITEASIQEANINTLLATQVGSALVPQAHDAHDLGTSAKRWKDGYFSGEVRAGGRLRSGSTYIGGDESFLVGRTIHTGNVEPSPAPGEVNANQDFGTLDRKWRNGYFHGQVQAGTLAANNIKYIGIGKTFVRIVPLSAGIAETEALPYGVWTFGFQNGWVRGEDPTQQGYGWLLFPLNAFLHDGAIIDAIQVAVRPGGVGSPGQRIEAAYMVHDHSGWPSAPSLIHSTAGEDNGNMANQSITLLPDASDLDGRKVDLSKRSYLLRIRSHFKGDTIQGIKITYGVTDLF